ncbi:MAG TPA: hypothetical protein PKI03_32105 [Pseudomonadota bacterium]|nr:hypothetical protein [Pseudomonadota bacterium]
MRALPPQTQQKAQGAQSTAVPLDQPQGLVQGYRILRLLYTVQRTVQLSGLFVEKLPQILGGDFLVVPSQLGVLGEAGLGFFGRSRHRSLPA